MILWMIQVILIFCLTVSSTLHAHLKITHVLAADLDHLHASKMLRTGNKYLEHQPQKVQLQQQLVIH